MDIFIKLVSVILLQGCLLLPAYGVPSKSRQDILQVPRMPDADGLLHLYDLPTGQGDGHVIQCPDGTITLYDLGANDLNTGDYWGGTEVQQFLEGHLDQIRNIVLTHGHWDHYNIFDVAFPNESDLPELVNVYISCVFNDMPDQFADWITSIGAESKIRTFNNGDSCGPIPGEDCGELDLCPNDPGVVGKVLSANLGQHCRDGGNKNIDCIVTKFIYGDISYLLTGDFEDETNDWDEDGPQKQMVDFYGDELQSTAYSISHHGADYLANKPVFRDAVAPKAIFVSGNPWYSYHHPRCSNFDAFINYVGSLCKPGIIDSEDPFYCGEHVIPDLTPEEMLQTTYTCGFCSSCNPERETRTDNDYAIYSTIPDSSSTNVVVFSADGERWGFRLLNMS